LSTADGPRGPRRPSRSDGAKTGRRGATTRPGARPDRRTGEATAKTRDERPETPKGKGPRTDRARADAPRGGGKAATGRRDDGGRRPDDRQPDRSARGRTAEGRTSQGRTTGRDDDRSGRRNEQETKRPGARSTGRARDERPRATREETGRRREDDRTSRTNLRTDRAASPARAPRRGEGSSETATRGPATPRGAKPFDDRARPSVSRPAAGRPSTSRRAAFASDTPREAQPANASRERRPPAMRWPVKVPTPRTAAPEPSEKTREGDRIAKLLARAGVASRRDIERMIGEGRIALNGEVLTTPATVLTSLHGVTVDGNAVKEPSPARLFLFYKPVGFLTAARDPKGRPTIYDSLPEDLPRLMPVGRLDFNTEGLLLLTTDGGLKRQLELPSSGIQRTYRARAFGTVTQDQLEDLIEGVEIDGMRYGRIDANLERRTGRNQWIEMTITEGKNREVRRVLEHLGLEVNRLIRTRYGKFTLDDAQPGDIVEVRQTDLIAFRKTLK